jgi:hypothetical protein
VCFVAQPINLLLVCTCGAIMLIIHHVQCEEECHPQSCSRPGAANALRAGSSLSGSSRHRRPTMRAVDLVVRGAKIKESKRGVFFRFDGWFSHQATNASR